MGMRSFWVLAAVAASLFAGGCGSTPGMSPGLDAQAKRFEAPPEGRSRLYIYRNDAAGPKAGVDVSVDGKFAGMTTAKTFVVADVPPGEHEIVSEGGNTSNLKVTTQAGQATFIRQDITMGGSRALTQMVVATPEQGRAGVLESALVDSALMGQGMPGTQAPMYGAAGLGNSAIPASPVVLPRSLYAYEAERAAKERGCQGPKGIRPAAQLRAKHGVIEDYDVTCTAGVVQVRCDMGMCATVR